jgi:hypothetical protein
VPKLEKGQIRSQLGNQEVLLKAEEELVREHQQREELVAILRTMTSTAPLSVPLVHLSPPHQLFQILTAQSIHQFTLIEVEEAITLEEEEAVMQGEAEAVAHSRTLVQAPLRLISKALSLILAPLLQCILKKEEEEGAGERPALAEAAPVLHAQLLKEDIPRLLAHPLLRIQAVQLLCTLMEVAIQREAEVKVAT